MNAFHFYHARLCFLLLWVCLTWAAGHQRAKSEPRSKGMEHSQASAIRRLGGMKDNLLDSVHGFVYEQALTGHRQEQYRGNLAEIKKLMAEVQGEVDATVFLPLLVEALEYGIDAAIEKQATSLVQRMRQAFPSRYQENFDEKPYVKRLERLTR